MNSVQHTMMLNPRQSVRYLAVSIKLNSAPLHHRHLPLPSPLLTPKSTPQRLLADNAITTTTTKPLYPNWMRRQGGFAVPV